MDFEAIGARERLRRETRTDTARSFRRDPALVNGWLCLSTSGKLAAMFQKVLIVNRGEVASRIARTVKRLGAEAIGVFTDADTDAIHCQDCDQSVRIGDTTAAYTDLKALLEAADSCGADALHPGYGSLAESVELARAAVAAGITFVGPNPDALLRVTDRLEARQFALNAGMRVIEASAGAVTELSEAVNLLYELGAALVKPVRGGVGVQSEYVDSEAGLEIALRRVSQNALAACGDGRVYLERAIARPRHIEIQVLADEHGEVLAIGDRECSIQRDRTRLLDESPAPALHGTERSERTRDSLWDAATTIVREAACTNAINVEFLLDEHGDAYFLELRPSLSVAHGVTEICSNVDLVEAQLVIAHGEPIPADVQRAIPSGHAIEVRLRAEQANRNGPPATGRVTEVRWPNASPGRMRIEPCVQVGTNLTSEDDTVLAKLITYAPTRYAALLMLDRVLAECSVAPLPTNAAFLRRILGHESFRAGQYDVDFVEQLRKP